MTSPALASGYLVYEASKWLYKKWTEGDKPEQKIPLSPFPIGNPVVYHFHPVAFAEQMRKLDYLFTNWIEGYKRNIEGQNLFNKELAIAAEQYPEIDPIIFKSLIAQESAFKPKIYNSFGYAGLTQCSLSGFTTEANYSTGTTSKSTGSWVFDMQGDERFDPQKSILGGMAMLKNKIDRVNKKIPEVINYNTEEKWSFYLASYNAGEGTILDAYNSAKNNGNSKPSWKDLIKNKEQSYLYAAIPSSWGKDGKYKEITEYIEQILNRANQ